MIDRDTDNRQYRLDREAVIQFHRQGYLGPFQARTPEEMDEIRRHIDEEVLTTSGPLADPPTPVWKTPWIQSESRACSGTSTAT